MCSEEKRRESFEGITAQEAYDMQMSYRKALNRKNKKIEHLESIIEKYIHLSNCTKYEDCQKADDGNCVVYNIRELTEEISK